MTEKMDSENYSAGKNTGTGTCENGNHGHVKRGNGKGFFFGILVILFFWLVLGSYMVRGVTLLLTNSGMLPDTVSSLQESADTSTWKQITAGFVILQSSFIPLLTGILITVRCILHIPVNSFMTSRPRFRLKRAALAFGAWFSAAALFSFLEFLLFPGLFSAQFPTAAETSAAAGSHFPAEIFFLFLLLACFFIPVQVFAEEMLFRAYLWNWAAELKTDFMPSMHSLRYGWTRNSVSSTWLPAVISGLLFAAAHAANPEIAQTDVLNRILLLLHFFLFGLFLMLATILDGGIETAVGIHLANNIFTLVILNYRGSALPTPSLFLTESLNPAGSLLFLCIGFLTIRFTLFRRNAQNA